MCIDFQFRFGFQIDRHEKSLILSHLYKLQMRCCGFNGTIIDILYTNGCTFSVGCFDYLAGTINTYGSCYIAVLIANIVAGASTMITKYIINLLLIFFF